MTKGIWSFFRKHAFSLTILAVAIVLGGGCLFTTILWRNSSFVPTYEYKSVPENAILPKGLEIRIDMQTGERWARKIRQVANPANIIAVNTGKEEKESKTDNDSSSSSSSYTNTSSKRWRMKYAQVASEIETALDDLAFDESTEDALDVLEQESSGFEVGAGILNSPKFLNLRKLVLAGNEEALNVLFSCLQNNAEAIKRALEIGVLQEDIMHLFKKEFLKPAVFNRLLLITNAFMLNLDDDAPSKITINLLPQICELILTYVGHDSSVKPTERQVEVIQTFAIRLPEGNEDLKARLVAFKQ